jgi:hypothetical protein
MAHTLTLTIPDEVYQTLVKQAGNSGRVPEELAREWLAAALQRLSEDPLFRLAGAFQFRLPDVAERHHEYIGEGLKRKLSGGDDD